MNQTFAVNFLVEDLKRKKNQKIMMEELSTPYIYGMSHAS